MVLKTVFCSIRLGDGHAVDCYLVAIDSVPHGVVDLHMRPFSGRIQLVSASQRTVLKQVEQQFMVLMWPGSSVDHFVRKKGIVMAIEPSESTQPIAPLPPGRKRRSPRVSRVTFDLDGDGPILSLIRNSTFISRNQVIELCLKQQLRASVSGIRHRLDRYLESGFIRLVPTVTIHGGYVYQITTDGLSALESFGLGLGSISSKTENLPDNSMATHFLDLNEVRLAMSRDPIFGKGKWLTDPEIKARNSTPRVIPYAKAYDAVVKLTDRNDHEFMIGLEYERTIKSKADYEKIALEIEQEKQLACVLYVAGSTDLITRLLDLIRCPTFPLVVTGAAIFKQELLNVKVGFMAGDVIKTGTLRQYLVSLKHPV